MSKRDWSWQPPDARPSRRRSKLSRIHAQARESLRNRHPNELLAIAEGRATKDIFLRAEATKIIRKQRDRR